VNIIEAIRSGKPFKRKCMEEWFIEKDAEIVHELDGDILDLTHSCTFDSVFFCDDWEIKNKERRYVKNPY
jgi:hypothetical protein